MNELLSKFHLSFEVMLLFTELQLLYCVLNLRWNIYFPGIKHSMRQSYLLVEGIFFWPVQKLSTEIVLDELQIIFCGEELNQNKILPKCLIFLTKGNSSYRSYITLKVSYQLFKITEVINHNNLNILFYE